MSRATTRRRPPSHAGCIHHWVLPTPDGPTCTGVCQKCGAEREYFTGEQDWGRDSFRRFPRETT